MKPSTADDWRRKGFRIENGMLVRIPNHKPISGTPEGALVAAVKGNLSPQAEQREGSELERLFMELWDFCCGPALEREVGLVPGRLWRTDFLHRPSMTCIEVQGMRDHTSIKGFKRDCEKHFALFLLGYTVVTLHRDLITEISIAAIINKITKGRKSP